MLAINVRGSAAKARCDENKSIGGRYGGDYEYLGGHEITAFVATGTKPIIGN